MARFCEHFRLRISKESWFLQTVRYSFSWNEAYTIRGNPRYDAGCGNGACDAEPGSSDRFGLCSRFSFGMPADLLLPGVSEAC